MGLIVCIKRNNDIKMGFYQAVYGMIEWPTRLGLYLISRTDLGVGALSVPFASTQFAQMRHWNFYYLILLGMAVLNLVFISIVFGFKSMDGEFVTSSFLRRHPSDPPTRLPQTHWRRSRREKYYRGRHSRPSPAYQGCALACVFLFLYGRCPAWSWRCAMLPL